MNRQGQMSQTSALVLQPSAIDELSQIDDLMVGVNNGSGVMAVTGRIPGTTDGGFM